VRDPSIRLGRVLAGRPEEDVKRTAPTTTARSGGVGTGLGLAIAERAARAHGGRLELANATPHGLRAWLGLPLAPVVATSGAER